MHTNLFAKSIAAGLLAAASITAASAHVSLEKSEASSGSYKAVLRIPHGCNGKPTNVVHIDVPEGYVGVKPMPKAGWDLKVETGDYARAYSLHGKDVTSGVTSVTWSGGDLPDAFYDEFVLSGTLAGVEEGSMLAFKATQKCGTEEAVWDQIAAEGQDPHSLEHPAPVLKIIAGGHDAHAGHMAMGTMDATKVAEAATAGDLSITSGWARAMLPGQPAGGAYLTISNAGKEADRLVGVTSPAAGKVEVHSMEMANDVMVMRPVEGGLEVPAGATVELKPGGLHIMFMAVTEPFKEGDMVPVTLEFEKAGTVEVVLPVSDTKGNAAK